MAPSVSKDGSEVTISADEYRRLTTPSAKSTSSKRASTRVRTPEEVVRRSIPKPDGEWGRSPDGKRQGYNLEEESLLNEEQISHLRLTVKQYVYKFMDITIPFSQNNEDSWRAAFKKCRKVHPWLSYYEADWLLKALTQQLLRNTTKKYKWEDAGEDLLVEAIDRRAERDARTSSSSPPPAPKKKSARNTTPSAKTKSKKKKDAQNDSDFDDEEPELVAQSSSTKKLSGKRNATQRKVTTIDSDTDDEEQEQEMEEKGDFNGDNDSDDEVPEDPEEISKNGEESAEEEPEPIPKKPSRPSKSPLTAEAAFISQAFNPPQKSPITGTQKEATGAKGKATPRASQRSRVTAAPPTAKKVPAGGKGTVAGMKRTADNTTLEENASTGEPRSSKRTKK